MLLLAAAFCLRCTRRDRPDPPNSWTANTIGARAKLTPTTISAYFSDELGGVGLYGCPIMNEW